jgi:hypothetical protein
MPPPFQIAVKIHEAIEFTYVFDEIGSDGAFFSGGPDYQL